jgi:hypothetical protein
MIKSRALLGTIAATLISSAPQAGTETADQAVVNQPSVSLTASSATSNIIKERLEAGDLPRTRVAQFVKGPDTFSQSGGFSKFDRPGNRGRNVINPAERFKQRQKIQRQQRGDLSAPDVNAVFNLLKPV